MSRFRNAALLSSVLALLWLTANGATACPLCGAAGQPLSEQLKISEVVLLVRWVSAEPAKKSALGSTTYEIVGSLGPRKQQFKSGHKLTLAGSQMARAGDLLLLLGAKVSDDPKELDWSRPREFTQAAFDYLAKIPAATEPISKRLQFFVPFLEHPDTLIAIDAFGEFAAAQYEDVVPLASKFSREKLRTWVVDEPSPNRVGFYAMMLAHQRNAEDAELLLQQINAPVVGAEYRRGLDGLIVGYVMLTKEKGLEFINQKFLQPAASSSEAYAAMQALRFLWQYEPDCLKPDLVRASMRRLLVRTDFAELAVADLARWNDWGSIEAVVKLFDRPAQDAFPVRVAVVNYLRAAIASGEQEKQAKSLHEPPRFALKAREHLDKLRQREPDIVKHAERFSR